MGTGSFSGVESGRGVTLTPHPLLVRRSKNSRSILLRAFVACKTGETYLFLKASVSRSFLWMIKQNIWSCKSYPVNSVRYRIFKCFLCLKIDLYGLKSAELRVNGILRIKTLGILRTTGLFKNILFFSYPDRWVYISA
jgi:hypothetical protein